MFVEGDHILCICFDAIDCPLILEKQLDVNLGSL